MSVNDIIISPVNSKKIYILTLNDESYITENCGASFKYFSHEQYITNFIPNPTDPKTILALVPILCSEGDIDCQ